MRTYIEDSNALRYALGSACEWQPLPLDDMAGKSLLITDCVLLRADGVLMKSNVRIEGMPYHLAVVTDDEALSMLPEMAELPPLAEGAYRAVLSTETHYSHGYLTLGKEVTNTTEFERRAEAASNPTKREYWLRRDAEAKRQRADKGRRQDRFASYDLLQRAAEKNDRRVPRS